MTNLHACVEEISHSNVKVADRGSRWAANFRNANQSKFRKVRVDGCLVNDGPRADWIVTKVGVGSAIVELKGKDVKHACDQVFATLSHPDCQQWMEKRRALLIVCSRVPSFDTAIGKAQTRARKAGVRLTVDCRGGDFSIENLLGQK